jgi:hypothetical protein
LNAFPATGKREKGKGKREGTLNRIEIVDFSFHFPLSTFHCKWSGSVDPC